MRSIAITAALTGTILYWCASSASAEPTVACLLPTQQQISVATGASVGVGSPIASPTSCQRSGEGKIVTLALNQPRGGKSPVEQFNAGKQASLPSVTQEPVSAVGDDAYFVYFAGTTRAGCGVMVKKADAVFEIRVYGLDLDEAKMVAKALAQDVAGKI